MSKASEVRSNHKVHDSANYCHCMVACGPDAECLCLRRTRVVVTDTKRAPSFFGGDTFNVCERCARGFTKRHGYTKQKMQTKKRGRLASPSLSAAQRVIPVSIRGRASARVAS